VEIEASRASPTRSGLWWAKGCIDVTVLGSRVLTDTGADLGRVADVAVEANPDADVVGYEIEPSAALSSRKGRTLFLPLPDTLSVSVEALVPATAADYVQDDLAGFGEAVEAFRTRLRDDR
jgi:sporulation protein YlmC with PRC-barrel domain